MSALRRCLLVLSLLALRLAHAGQPCTEQPIRPETLSKAFGLALKTRESLDQSGAEVVMLARVGQDLSKWGLRYTHLGYVWRDSPSGRWTVLHELNQCGSARSALYAEGLANFYADDLFRWEGLILIPPADTQKRLAASFRSGAYAVMHEARYNMLAYPFEARYQNSNQWAIEVLADAEAGPFSGRGEAQAWLKRAGYQATTLKIDTATRLAARMFRANVAFDDQPFDRRMAGQIDTVTVESVYAWLARYAPGARRVLVRL
ncbi:DUF2145 domain-containing protein [Niveibacterium sp. 24ML]|uniref:DUF2145 domain-containing protein n=1 Tax=Niveibacterium sp. 24ML TaxID=2985512 RepID=UPI00226FF495|nr:DUF2145 domain-containing protein [Niveibacterium sp. 24ML]MCX9156251.1 DUF2145 domain-containing protein [Niveibacterium sp. 24ML]